MDEGWHVISRFDSGTDRRLNSALDRRRTICALFLARAQARIVVQRFLKQRGLCPTFGAESQTLFRFRNASNDVDVCPSPSTGIVLSCQPCWCVDVSCLGVMSCVLCCLALPRLVLFVLHELALPCCLFNTIFMAHRSP
jgi:hypothetical protein